MHRTLNQITLMGCCQMLQAFASPEAVYVLTSSSPPHLLLAPPSWQTRALIACPSPTHDQAAAARAADAQQSARLILSSDAALRPVDGVNGAAKGSAAEEEDGDNQMVGQPLHTHTQAHPGPPFHPHPHPHPHHHPHPHPHPRWARRRPSTQRCVAAVTRAASRSFAPPPPLPLPPPPPPPTRRLAGRPVCPRPRPPTRC